MTRRSIVLMILAAVVVLGLVKLLLPIVQDALHTGDGAVIRAEVRLINQCPLADSSFAVRNTDTGRSIPFSKSYCQIWCLRVLGHAAIWSVVVASIPSLNLTPVMTLAR
jgi:hypothetical protein